MKIQPKTLIATTVLLLTTAFATTQAITLTPESIKGFLNQTAKDMNALDYDAFEKKMGKDLIVVFQIKDKRFIAPLVLDVVRQNYLDMIKNTFDRATYYNVSVIQPHIKIQGDQAKFTATQSEAIKLNEDEFKNESRIQGIIKIEEGKMKYTRLIGELKMVSPLLN